jgi:hypothetical protein
VTSSVASSPLADPAGDDNAAPDIVTVSVSDVSSQALSVRVALANFQTLPENTTVTLRLDLDSNRQTGSDGFEFAARYSSDGTVDVLRYDGSELAPVSTSGVGVTVADGVVSYSIARSQLDGAGSFGVSVVASRTQTVGAVQVVASDFAPETGENAYSLPGDASYTDPRGDEDAAPDITSVTVSDAPKGPITFHVVTPNYPTLPADREVGLIIGLAGRPPLDDELFLTYVGSSQTVLFDREERGLAVPDEPPTRVGARYEDGALTLSIARNELGRTSAFRFGVVTADYVGVGEGEGRAAEGDLEAVDIAPDGLVDGKRFTYRLANPPAVKLSTDAPLGSPLLPIAGRPFAVSVVVRRSDAFAAVRRGAVSCKAGVEGRRVRASGAFIRGHARCRIVVPRDAVSETLRGTITIRSANRVATTRFSYPVRQHGGG